LIVSILDREAYGEGPNEFMYTKPLGNAPVFIKLVISVLVSALFHTPTSSILPVKRLSAIRELAPIFRGLIPAVSGMLVVDNVVI
jgi:hypothetical protein